MSERDDLVRALNGIQPAADAAWVILRHWDDQQAENERLVGLLARVEPELMPNTDAAEELRERLLGGDPLPGTALIMDIRAALAGEQQP